MAGLIQVEEADQMLAEIYLGQYRSLVRLAVLLLDDVPAAEDVVHEAFLAAHTSWRRLPDPGRALLYLRQAVIRQTRSVLRRRVIADRRARGDGPGADSRAGMLPERSAVIAALRVLPVQQREALVLRYYTHLPEAEIAATMGVSRSAVKRHCARGMATLRSVLES